MRYWKVDEKGQLRVLIGEVWRKAKWHECWACGKKFAFPTNQLGQRNKGKYCSLSCSAKWAHKRYYKARTKKRCAICLGFYAIPPSKAHRYKTCGKPECVRALRSITSKKYQAEKRAQFRAEVDNGRLRNKS